MTHSVELCRATTAGRPGRAADDEPRRLHGQAGLPLELRLSDMLGVSLVFPMQENQKLSVHIAKREPNGMTFQH